jgi:nucleoid DNA-binding protein
MTKSDLISALMEKENLTHKDAEAVVKLISSVFFEALRLHKRCSLDHSLRIAECR